MRWTNQKLSVTFFGLVKLDAEGLWAVIGALCLLFLLLWLGVARP